MIGAATAAVILLETTTDLVPNPGDVTETDTFSAAVMISLNDLHRREATYNFTVDEFHS